MLKIIEQNLIGKLKLIQQRINAVSNLISVEAKYYVLIG